MRVDQKWQHRLAQQRSVTHHSTTKLLIPCTTKLPSTTFKRNVCLAISDSASCIAIDIVTSEATATRVGTGPTASASWQQGGWQSGKHSEY